MPRTRHRAHLVARRVALTGSASNLRVRLSSHRTDQYAAGASVRDRTCQRPRRPFRLSAVAHLLEPVGHHPPVGGKPVAEPNRPARAVPLDPPWPTAPPVHKRGMGPNIRAALRVAAHGRSAPKAAGEHVDTVGRTYLRADPWLDSVNSSGPIPSWATGRLLRPHGVDVFGPRLAGTPPRCLPSS
jgi:hypothetical protein